MTTRRTAAQGLPTRGWRTGRASCGPRTRQWRRGSRPPWQQHYVRTGWSDASAGTSATGLRRPARGPRDLGRRRSSSQRIGRLRMRRLERLRATSRCRAPPRRRACASSRRAKYGGVPTLPSSSSSSSGSSRSVPESELRALRRASRAAASDAAWQEEEEEPPVPPPRRTPRRPAGAARPPGLTPPQPVPRTRTESAPSPSARTEPAPPPPARTRSKFPRGHPFHTGPRLLHLPLEMRWEPVPGSWVGVPPTWELFRKFNRRDCTGAQVQCPHQRIHACSQCGGGHPASHCLVAEEDLPPPDPPQGPPQRR